ncbi:Lar family restriction alleviation protein [Paracoccus sulfuroxidans]|uniref:Restriction alleviation protein Lar n=1 Tax=Paracoccus sulfuroxidans TaxID=384678 RepID=A0A562P1N9_9RHOB|nr:Lar family restriction alleviation protein [Paracoccus sulfuroxidans]TWI38354.1 hypothetical protein IQ24_00494 [Paracoccus sulfuroxidans]
MSELEHDTPTAHAGARQDSTPEQAAPELLPCPFCGDGQIEDWGEATWSRPTKGMLCTCCGARGPRVMMERGEEYDAFVGRVKAEWNRREAADMAECAAFFTGYDAGEGDGCADLAAPSAPAEVEGLVLPKMFGVCQHCIDYGNAEEAGHHLEDLRWDGEVWSCEYCWNPDESESWADAPKAATALTAQQAENERLRGERQALAEAICGGEDFPGLLAATSVDALVDTARREHRCHRETIDARLKAESAIAHLTAELAEAREKNGALIERAADIADTYRDSCTPGGMQAISDTIACSIRALATEAETIALAEIVKKAVDAETRDMRKALEDLLKAHESGWPDKQDWGAGDRARATIARLDQRKEAGA